MMTELVNSPHHNFFEPNPAVFEVKFSTKSSNQRFIVVAGLPLTQKQIAEV